MKKSVLVLAMILLGCRSGKHHDIIKISLVDSSSLKVTGIDNDILQEINRDTITTVWLSLIPVYRMPADTDMKDFQKPQPGKYVVEDNAVVFTPDTPFAKQCAYFVRYYQHGTGNSEWDVIEQQKKLGKIPYIDLIFKR